MSAIVTIGIDLAKNVFAVHGVDVTGKPEIQIACPHHPCLPRSPTFTTQTEEPLARN